MRILTCGVAVIEGDLAHGSWIEELGTIHHDPWMRDQVCRHIKPGDVVVQGGANIGTLTRAMLDAGATVIAFEPNFAAFECLRCNCPEAFAYPVALSDEHEWRAIHVDTANAGATHIGSVQTLRGGVPCNAIDYYEASPALILIDIEGYEVRALRGAAETIARCKPVIICEVNRGALERAGSSDVELLELLESYGYTVKVMQPDCHFGMPQFDVECLPK